MYDADNAYYNRIDSFQMGKTSADFGLDLFIMTEPYALDFVNRTPSSGDPGPSTWWDLDELLQDKYIFLYRPDEPVESDYPSIIAALIKEPVMELDPANPSAYIQPLDLWETYYLLGGSVDPNDHDVDLIADLETSMSFLPDALILDEPCNWAEVAHAPPYDDSGRVPTFEVREFIDATQDTPTYEDEFGDEKMDSWAYMSERGAVMIGIDSWAFGGLPVQEGPRMALSDTGSPFGKSQARLQFQYTCGSGTLVDFDLSFLHMDLVVSEGEGSNADNDAGEYLRLHVYVRNSTGGWTQVGTGSPGYIGDSIGGFPFFDPNEREVVELIKIEDIHSQVNCFAQPQNRLIKLVAECHADDDLCDLCTEDDNGEVNGNCDQGEAPGLGAEPTNSGQYGYVADIQIDQVSRTWPQPPPGQSPTPVDTPTHTQVNMSGSITLGSTVTAVNSDTNRLLSTSNITYRYLHQPPVIGDPIPVVDSVIVRYGHGLLGECAETGELERCSEAQVRLMQAVGDAVGGDDDNLSLNYFETQSWSNFYDLVWFFNMMLSTEDYTDGMVGGRYSLGYWELMENGGEHGEFAQRTEILEYYDENETTSPSQTDDDYTLFFFYPTDRDEDALPGWYQRYTAEFDFADDPGLTELSFEIARVVCSGCGLEEAADAADRPDMVIEFTYERIDGVEVDEGSHTFLLEDGDTFVRTAYDDETQEFTNPNLYWKRTEGEWRFNITMYNISRPQSRRHGFFRFIEAGNGTDSVTYDIIDPADWYNPLLNHYETGVWTADPLDDRHIPLAFDLDDLDPSNNWEAAEHSLDVMACMRAFWTNPLFDPWEDICVDEFFL